MPKFSFFIQTCKCSRSAPLVSKLRSHFSHLQKPLSTLSLRSFLGTFAGNLIIVGVVSIGEIEVVFDSALSLDDSSSSSSSFVELLGVGVNSNLVNESPSFLTLLIVVKLLFSFTCTTGFEDSRLVYIRKNVKIHKL